MTEFDYIIVGGGAAGCVLANHLTAKASVRVLVCEAGSDVRDDDAPEQILDSFAAHAFLDSRFLWNDLEVTTDANAARDGSHPPVKRRKYEQARVLGGGSSVNGQLANRGAPWDYDEWEQRGAAGWRWDTVLPYFKKLERDIDFDGPLHGTCGPMPIRRIFPPLWAEHAKAMAEGFRSIGFEYLEDQNGEFRDGYHPFAINNLYDRRVPTAIAYLTPTVRQRPNLRIETETTVTDLLFDGNRCAGVRTLKGGAVAGEFRASREVIVACGAIYSPPQLLRAGIGPAAELQSLGIEVRHDLAGVGKRLMDHPSVAIGAFVKPYARLRGKTRRHLLVGLRFSSMHADAPPGDMAVSVSTKAAWHAVGEQMAVTIWVNKTFSEAGEVTLSSSEWRTPPRVDFRLLHDRRDVERLMAAMRRLRGAFDAPEMQAAVEAPFAASFSEKVRQVGVINRANAIKTSILARLLDGPEFLRRLLFRALILEAPPLDQLLADDEGLEAFIRRASVGVWHASCSCRMGASTDPLAVTDNQGRVHGVPGLRLVDASIIPVIPSANVHLTVLMLAEKIADEMLACL